jgi:hypothetical protein
MSIRWQVFPRSSRAPSAALSVIAAFESTHLLVTSESRDLPSNDVLTILKEDLFKAGFIVESGKALADKIQVPVLFGLNGAIAKSFHADAFHPTAGLVLEVEAGRAVDNNQFLKDLFQACMMQDARHLMIAVRNLYRGSDDFAKVCTFFDTLYASARVQLPLESITILGY